MSNTRMLSKTGPTFEVESIRTCQPINAWWMSTTYRSISDAAWQDIFRTDIVVACLDIPVSLEPARIQFLLSRITADGAVREDLVVIPGVFRQWLHTALTTPGRICVLCRVWMRGNTGVDAQNFQIIFTQVYKPITYAVCMCINIMLLQYFLLTYRHDITMYTFG